MNPTKDDSLHSVESPAACASLARYSRSIGVNRFQEYAIPMPPSTIATITEITTERAGLGLFFASPLFHAPSIINAKTARPAPNHAPILTCNIMNSTGVRTIMLTSSGSNPISRSQSTTLWAIGIPIAIPKMNNVTISFILLLMCSEICLKRSLISGLMLKSSSIHSSSHRWDGVESIRERPACLSLTRRCTTNPVIHMDGRDNATAFHISSLP